MSPYSLGLVFLPASVSCNHRSPADHTDFCGPHREHLTYPDWWPCIKSSLCPGPKACVFRFPCATCWSAESVLPKCQLTSKRKERPYSQHTYERSPWPPDQTPVEPMSSSFAHLRRGDEEPETTREVTPPTTVTRVQEVLVLLKTFFNPGSPPRHSQQEA